MSNAPIETRGLGKRYGRVTALEDLNLRVEEGEVFGFLGPNGAGKTTTIRLLLGLIRPTAGGFQVLARADIGYLPGELALWPYLTGRATLSFLARLAGRAPVQRDVLCERLGFEDGDLARPVRTYSDGMKQKIGIIQALQCAPRLLLLDEPTKGLDPLMQQAFYEVLAEARGRGATVFFSSHVLTEVERVSDRVGMLRGGRLVKVAGVEELQRAQRRRVVASFSADVDGAALDAFGEVVERSPRRIELLAAQERLPALVARLGLLPLVDVVVEAPRLEDAFLELYR